MRILSKTDTLHFAKYFETAGDEAGAHRDIIFTLKNRCRTQPARTRQLSNEVTLELLEINVTSQRADDGKGASGVFRHHLLSRCNNTAIARQHFDNVYTVSSRDVACVLFMTAAVQIASSCMYPGLGGCVG